jgi:cytochrome c peroxidase
MSHHLDRLDRPSRLALALALSVLAGAAASAQLPPPPAPPQNAMTPAKVRLGKALFWDEQLSSTRTVACGTCHIPATGGGDPRSAASPLAIHPGPDGLFGGADDILGSPGVPRTLADGSYIGSTHFGFREQPTGRRTISSVNAAYSPELFWDGRAPGQFVDPVTAAVVIPAGGALESQAVGPLVNDVEMAHVGRTWADVIARVAASTPLALAARAPAALLDWIDGRSYAQLFAEAFPSDPAITAPNIAMAIASYERTQFTAQTPFDAFLESGDVNVFTPLEQQGFDVFSSANCNSCHQNALMSNNTFRFTGVRPRTDDIGREAVTGLTVDKGRMRVPSLRNVELRPPFMRNGRFPTIESVVDFYDAGGHFDVPDAPVAPLNLTPQEKVALAAFLKRPLTDPRLAGELPPFDRPGLYTETDRVPETGLAPGIAGSGGLVPSAVALEPPYLGNPSFTVAVHDGLGGANALLVIDDDADPGTTPPGSGDFAFEAVVLGGSGDGEGFSSVSLPIADLPANLDRELYGRWYVTDAGAAGGTAVSPLFRFRIFAPLEDTIVFIDGFETNDTTDWSSTVP